MARNDLVVIVPSRGRPHIVADLDAAFAETCSVETTLAVLALDEDDPTLDAYREAMRGRSRVVAYWTQPAGNMVTALNGAALAHEFGAFALGFMGDDHRPRTTGWDRAYLAALTEMGTGIVYGDDLLQSERLPTQCAMTTDIIRALGWMSPPQLTHLMVDNFWLDLGRGADCLRYMPDVVVEHMHPYAGKAEWDEGHRRVNEPAMYHRDRVAYTRFKAQGGLTEAIATVRALRGVA